MSSKKHYILVIKGDCPHCNKAISLLKKKKLQFSFTDMQYDAEALAAIKQQASWETVPMIWEQEVNWKEKAQVTSNKFIGGNTELQEFLKPKKRKAKKKKVTEEK